MSNTYKKIITPIYIINIVFQALFSLISPIAIMFLLGFLLVKYLSIGTWIYVVLMILGVFSGLYSMVIFIIRASSALETIEKQNSDQKNSRTKKEEDYG